MNSGLTPETAASLIESHEADLASFASSYIANPDLVERLRDDSPLAVPDPSTFYTPGAKGYSDYPALKDMAYTLSS